MTLSFEQKRELFKLIMNKIRNRRYKIDIAILESVTAQLAEELIMPIDRPLKDRE